MCNDDNQTEYEDRSANSNEVSLEEMLLKSSASDFERDDDDNEWLNTTPKGREI